MTSDTDDENTKDKRNDNDLDHLDECITQGLDFFTSGRSKSTDENTNDHGQDNPECEVGSPLQKADYLHAWRKDELAAK